MTNIFFLTDGIYSNKLSNNYLRKRNFLANFFFFLRFRNLDFILNISKKNNLHNWYIFELADPENRG